MVVRQQSHHGDDVVVVVSCGLGHPHHMTSVSGWGLPIRAHVGVWASDQAGARHLTHYGDGDDSSFRMAGAVRVRGRVV